MTLHEPQSSIAQGNPTPDDGGREGRGRPRKGGLGRGLGALIPTLPENETGPAALEVDINAISPNPYQPRTALDQAKLEQLAESIRLHGVIQPLVVRRAMERDRYELIAGERRWRAARLAGLTTVPVVVKEAAPQAMLEMALVENVVRADLTPLEEALAYRQLIEEFGLTQASVAERVGRSRVSVTNTLRLLSAPEPVQVALQTGQITEGHARALLGLPTGADQIAMLELILEKGWSVRQTEEAVRKWVAGAAARSAEKEPDPQLEAIEERFQRALGTRVSLKRGSRGSGGTLTIHFSSDEELTSLYERIVGEDLL
ncbi:MAG TPA: ParB/RepB/Spo0J family partition protein [Thermomicrobiales bacterium]